IGGGWPQGFDANLFHLQATLPAGEAPEAFEQALDGELERLVQEGISEQELQRAKNITAADFWRGVATIDGKARLLGEYAVMHGDHRRLFSAPEAYERVSREEVLGVARAVFRPTQRTVGVLQPVGAAAAGVATGAAEAPAELGSTYAAEIDLAMGLAGREE